MPKLIFLSIILAISSLFAQKSPKSDNFWQRISLETNASYYFSPWENYNDALSIVSHQIRHDPFFKEPTGFYDKINGDLLWQGRLGFQVYKNFSVNLNYQTGKIAAGFEFYANPEKFPPDTVFRTVIFHQEITFQPQSFGLGLRYEKTLLGKLSVFINGGMDWYRGNLDVSWRHIRNAYHTGPILPDEGEKLTAKLKENILGWQGGAGFVFNLFGPVFVQVAAQYRHARFTDLRGNAEFDRRVGDESQPVMYEVELVGASNFFGVRWVGENKENLASGSHVFPPLTFRTMPERDVRQPATIDLSAFGLQTGIKIRL